jgi:hypothetical protein
MSVGPSSTRSDAAGSVSADSVLLIDVVQAVLHRNGGQRWVVAPGDAWCAVQPPEGRSRRHGWKLHVSATPLSAPLVLARSAEVLVQHGCPFKFATDVARVAELVGIWFARGSAGKFITAYPHSDEQFRRLADELHRATAGLAGPRILSDKQFAENSLVHYRYGAFSDDAVFTDDGVYESRLVGPDGSVVLDERKAWFTPPPWAPVPFPEQSAAATVAPESPVLGGRFRVRTVIRHANRGGIYRATDERNGADVLVKQARPHVGAMLDGTDVRDRLREEARMLDLLSPLALFPATVALFEEQGHLFLAEEWIPGTTIDRYLAGRPITQVDVVGLAGRLVAAALSVHEAGLAIRDLKPANVMVTPAGTVRMIDAEHVAALGQKAYPAFTRAFAAPEVRPARMPAEVTTLAQAADCFSLGVTVFSMLTAMSDVEWIFGSPSAPRSDRERDALVSTVLADHKAPAAFGRLIAGLTRTDPARRWPSKRAEEFLSSLPDARKARAARAAPAVRTPPGSLDCLLTDAVAQLRRTMTPNRSQLWPEPRLARSDPANAWLGAAGGLSTLARARAALGDESLDASLALAARWIDERLFAVPRLLPGLAFGRAGTAWALYDAAAMLGPAGGALAARAVELARRLPTEAPIVDLTHGLAGAGMARLHLWRNTGDADLLRQAAACAEAVLRAARRHGNDWSWPTPLEVDSAVAGNNTYGMAHGIAGVGTFLLAAAQAVERGDDAGRYREAASGAGDTLLRAARIQDGQPVWPSEVGGDDYVTPSGHWCNGAAGIGSFLIRLWSATGEWRFADLAQRCVPTRHGLWHSVIGACCGLAGVGHCLLDLAEFTNEGRFRADAEYVADLVYARRHVAGDLEITCPPDRGSSYKDGTAGVLAFLLRLRYGGPTPWLPHQHAVATAPAEENSDPTRRE